MNIISLIDVLIVGAGPAGMTLACDLARRQKTIRIIDQLETPPVGTRARGISPRSLEIFEDLGILKSLVTHAELPLSWRIYDNNNKIVREIDQTVAPDPSMLPTPDSPYSMPLQVSQRYTDSILCEHLLSYGTSVEWATKFIGFTQYADFVVAEIEYSGKRSSVRARVLVGCDGGRSVVRTSAGIPFQGETLDDPPSIVANVGVVGLDSSYWHFWTNRPFWGLTLQPMLSDNTWLFSTNLTSEERDITPAPTLETVQQLFDQRVGLPNVSFSDLTWFSTFRHNVRLAEYYRMGRVFLAGDSAHVGIAGGQGMNTAIQDAYNLGWKLASVLNGAPQTLLDTYQEERQDIARRFLATSVAHHSSSAAPFSSTQAITRLRDVVVDLSQLSIAYHKSSLSHNLDAATGIRAGERAPDAPDLLTQDGKKVRLFDLFRGTHFTLLIFGERPLAQLPPVSDGFLQIYVLRMPDSQFLSDCCTLIDSANHAHSAYGISGNALILIRPDGYIGLVTGNSDMQPILEYLRPFITE